MTLDDNSEKLLNGVHPDLVAVVHRARDLTEFRVTEGLRSIQRQKQLVAQKKSQTLKSRHITGHAVDLVDLKGSYVEGEMKRIAEAMKAAATELGIKLVWGGDWTSFQDTPHFELERHAYPESDMGSKIKAAAAGFSIPAVPAAVTTNTTNVQNWQGVGEQVSGFGSWLISNPVKACVAIGIAVVLGWIVPRFAATEEGAG